MPKTESPSARKKQKSTVAAKSNRAKRPSPKKRTASRTKAQKVAVESVQAAPFPSLAADHSGPGPAPKRSPPKSKRLPPRKTFLIAATFPEGVEQAGLHVYAVVKRGPAEALSAVRDHLGDLVKVEMTGKLSGRMSKILGLKPDEIRQI